MKGQHLHNPLKLKGAFRQYCYGQPPDFQIPSTKIWKGFIFGVLFGWLFVWFYALVREFVVGFDKISPKLKCPQD